eukprot:CAMPEP_0179114402 /NCGR_PEP_ID=MMETSP0796-20121207/53567_1 /TAXON_ID=73915 /ORGANISM="Pyrodinium bahamense, Strain pbaha01" /LENGTH=342 /DNA_ID=CAMNT_0020812623 /DNA_START=86 /DNA_END=1114 /DNA_ORIENTATION=-
MAESGGDCPHEDSQEAKPDLPAIGFHAVHLREDIQDALDREQVPTELLTELARKEDRAFVSSCDGKPLPKVVRRLAVCFLGRLLGMFAAPSAEDWSAAAVLLDAFVAQAAGGLRLGALPATCVAIAKIVKKMDSVEIAHYLAGMNSKVVAAASQLAQCLQRLGYRQDPVDTQELHRQEWELLRTLRWQITLPCQESWLSIFCTRLDVLTASILQTSIGWAREQSTAMVNTLVMWQATSARLPPRRMAAGALSINLARAGLLPLEALRAPEVSSAQWGHLLVEAGIKEPSRQSSLNSSLVQYTLQALQTAVGCSRTTLQKASELVLRDVCNLRGDEQGHVASR